MSPYAVIAIGWGVSLAHCTGGALSAAAALAFVKDDIDGYLGRPRLGRRVPGRAAPRMTSLQS
ncbi:MAG TPA: hypothetical protein VFG96_00165 [Jiangellaceae bacterium]|nr:hypothetical protein [Jiangellaceae bacterium]